MLGGGSSVRRSKRGRTLLVDDAAWDVFPHNDELRKRPCFRLVIEDLNPHQRLTFALLTPRELARIGVWFIGEAARAALRESAVKLGIERRDE